MEELKENADVKKQTYLNRETGHLLSAETEIEHYKTLQNDEIINNLLLGEFTKEGNYVISKDYLLQLIAVRKTIKENYENKYILIGIIPANTPEIKFTLKIDAIEGNKKLAILRCIETSIKLDGETKEILKTVVARYKDDDDIYFMTKVAKVFNIVKVDEAKGADASDEELIGLILNRWKNLKRLGALRGEKLDYLSKMYIDEIIALLRANPGKLSEYILRRYEINLNNLAGIAGKPGYYKKVKLMLDKLLDESMEKVKDPIIEKLIDASRAKYVEAYKSIHRELTEVKPIIAPKKAEETKIASKKKSSEAKKSPGGKKKDAGASAAKPAGSKKPVKRQYYPERPRRIGNAEPQTDVTKQPIKQVKPKSEATREVDDSLDFILAKELRCGSPLEGALGAAVAGGSPTISTTFNPFNILPIDANVVPIAIERTEVIVAKSTIERTL